MCFTFWAHVEPQNVITGSGISLGAVVSVVGALPRTTVSYNLLKKS